MFICDVPGCGAYANYLYGESLLRGIRGRRYCKLHRPLDREEGER